MFDTEAETQISTSNRLGWAVEMVDDQFGQGYSRANPEIVAALLLAMTHDVAAMTLTAELANLREDLEKLIATPAKPASAEVRP
jgi:hypothetical protein